ncbi:MAG: Gfo/Idh/MocA family oxidoreductase [Chloroflexota bacterium]|nr:Gfo/Idh/MocA family oxidoreductase [Chloroflexota bacterium]
MPERVAIGLIGCGGMGRRHLRGLAELTKTSHANMDLVAVCDPDQANAGFAAEEAANLLGRRPRVYAALADMIDELGADLQAASITTDTGSHHAVAVACLERGLHILCEKPLAVTVRGCHLIMAAAQRANRIVSVAENYRRDPINRLARALIAEGAIGTPRLMIETNIGGTNAIAITPWRHMKHTGGIVVDAGIHYADILRYYLGEARTIYGEVRLHEKVRYNTRSAGPGGYYAHWSAGFPDQVEPTGEDALYAHVSFESGAIGHWIDDHAGHGQPTRARLVFGSHGSLDCPGDRNGRPIRLHLDGHPPVDDQRVLEYAPNYRLDPLAAELFGHERAWRYDLDFNATDARLVALEYHELGTCIVSGAQPEVTAQEGLADLALTYAPYESGRLGRAVTLAEVAEGRADDYQREIDIALGLVAGQEPSPRGVSARL